jgi:putative transposase
MAKVADLVEQPVHETLTYNGFPDIHWQKIRTNNPLERIMKEIRRRTRVVDAFAWRPRDCDTSLEQPGLPNAT